MTADPKALLEHASWLRRLARHLVGDDAEELVQETWVAALRRPPEHDRDVRPWLRAVATNLARFRWRSAKNRRAREEASGERGEAPSSEDLLERHETQQLLARLVGELDEPFRTTILLSYAEGLTPTQIARRLGVPAGTVRWRRKEALERLRVQLDAAHRGDRRAWMIAFVPLATRRTASASGLAFAVIAVVLVASLGWWLVGRGESSSSSPVEPPIARSSVGPQQPQRAAVALPDLVDPPGWLAQAGVPRRRITGRVIADGKPAAGVLVRLTSELTDTGVIPVRDLRSGADGRFDFGEQLPRPYVVAAAAPAKLAALRHLDLRDPTAPEDIELVLVSCVASLHGTVSDASGGPIAGAEILREGAIGTETATDGSYELCVLPTAASLSQLHLMVSADGYGTLGFGASPSGRVRRDLVLSPEAVVTGRVLSPDGKPVEHAKVWLEPDIDGAAPPIEWPGAIAAETDAVGRFRIAGVGAGRLRVFAAGRGLTAHPVDIALGAGDSRELELTMRATGIVRGRVVHAGQPVAGVRIETKYPDWLACTADCSDSAISQGDGSFVLDRVALGPARFETRPFRIVSPRELAIVEGDRNSIELVVEPLGAIRGKVTRHGVPVPFARIGIWGTSSSEMNADAAGRYEATGLEPGTYSFYADDTRLGAGIASTDSVRVALAEQVSHDVELAWGARVSGTVVDPTRQPVVGAHIRVREVVDDARAIDVGRCVTGTGGAFACAQLRGGAAYEIGVFANEDAAHAFRFVSPPPTLTLANGDARVDNVQLVVDPAVRAVAGVVVDRDGGPIADARVVAMTTEQRRVFSTNPRTVTADDGAFRIAHLAPGEYVLEVSTVDGRHARRTVPAGTSNLSLVVESPQCDAAARTELPNLTKPTARLVWEDQIALVGWKLPERVQPGTPFEITFVYEVLRPIGRKWTVFVHLDGALRHNADHEPAAGRCPTSAWRAGDRIVDRFTTTIPAKYPPGAYAIWTGFFTGWTPRYRNLVVTDAPSGVQNRDTHPNAIRIGELRVE